LDRDLAGEEKDPEGYWEAKLWATGGRVRFVFTEVVPPNPLMPEPVAETYVVFRTFAGKLHSWRMDVDMTTDTYKTKEAEGRFAIVEVAEEGAPGMLVDGKEVYVGKYDMVEAAWERLENQPDHAKSL